MVLEWKIKQVPVKNIKRAAYNPRLVNSAAVSAYKRNREIFGVIEPIVLNNDLTIIGGHQRYDVEVNEGCNEVEAMVAMSLLDSKKEQELSILLNSTGGETDEDLLRQFGITQDILDATGFRDFRLHNFEVEDIGDEPAFSKIKKGGNKLRLTFSPIEAEDIKHRLENIASKEGLTDVVEVFIFLFKKYAKLD